MYVPKRGDYVWLDFNPQSGHEQMGNRPALVLSPEKFNRRVGLAFVCPISNTQRKSPFYIAIPRDAEVTGVVMADQLRSLDFRARQARFIAHCHDSVMDDVLRRIKPILFSQNVG